MSDEEALFKKVHDLTHEAAGAGPFRKYVFSGREGGKSFATLTGADPTAAALMAAQERIKELEEALREIVRCDGSVHRGAAWYRDGDLPIPEKIANAVRGVMETRG